MGRYLACGIATRLCIKKSRFDTNERELKKLGEKIDLELYNIDEREEIIELNMKENVLEDNIISFIQEQLFNFARKRDIGDYEKLDELKGKAYEELMKIADEKSYYSFQFFKGNRVCNDVSYLLEDSDIYADIITFLIEGKVIMECYNDLFIYLRNIIINSSSNKIKSATVVSLIG